MKCCEITAGMLRHTVEIQQATKTPNGSGGFVDAWATIATIKGAMRAKSGYERMQAARLDAQTKNELTIRYRADIHERHRIVFDGKRYGITFINDLEFRKRWLVIDLDGGVAT